MKKFLLVLLILLVSIVVMVYIFRYDIFQYSAETIIKSKLPDYVSVDRLIFDSQNNLFVIKALKIENPKGFRSKYVVQIDSVVCKYRMASRNILNGIKITEITAAGPVINIERASNGQINVNEMGNVMTHPGLTPESKTPAARVLEKPKTVVKREFSEKALNTKNISDLVKLTDTVTIKDGRIIFTDGRVSLNPYVLVFERLNGTLGIDLSRDYKSVRSVRSTGSGFINGGDYQKIAWTIFLDLTKKSLTMSNECDIKDVDIKLFEPYYDTYSPIIIHRGTCSGTLVFNFDNGNIGSDNTLRIKNLDFSLKDGGIGSKYWDENLPEVIKYLENASGEVVFDFKIKGDIKSPRFYPGPEVKKALQNLVINKVAGIVDGFGGDTSSEGDVGRVIDLVKGMLSR